jgi:hypothetical protein
MTRTRTRTVAVTSDRADRASARRFTACSSVSAIGTATSRRKHAATVTVLKMARYVARTAKSFGV